VDIIKPLKDKILVSRIAGEKQTEFGIILKTSEGPDKALVEEIGPLIDEVSIGDEVLINWNGAVKVSGKETDKEYYIVAVEHIVLIY
jgi:co-chaperonin GroES (HSP10)